MPLEAERDEALVRAGEELVVATSGAERAKRERLDRRLRLDEVGRFRFDAVMASERDESVHPRGEDARTPHESALDGKLHQRLHRRPVAAEESDPDPRPTQVRLVALAGQP